MPGSPYLLGIEIFDTDGTTALENVKVQIRNENTNDNASLNTDADGQVFFQLANASVFTKGWTVGDIVSFFVLYKGFESTSSLTLTDKGGSTQSLTLVAVAEAPSLRYFTPQEFLDYFSISTIDSDSENGLKPETIVKVGEGVEQHIERILNRTYDNNSGSNYQVTDELYEVKLTQRIWFLKNTPIVSIQRFEVNTNLPGESPNFDNIMFQQIDAADATTDWSASTDGVITLNTTNGEFNQGTGALNITKTGSTTDNVTYSKTLSSSFDFTNSLFKLEFYVEDTSELASAGSTQVEIRIGSDSSNYYSKTFDNIAQGNWISLSLRHNSTDSSASTTGTPDATSSAYVAIKITYSASGTTVTAGDMRLDNLRLNEEDDLDINLDIGRIAIATFSNFLDRPTFGYYHHHFITFPEPGLNQVKVTYKHGQSVPSDIRRLAILMTARAFGSQMLQALNIKTSESSGLNSSIQNQDNFKAEIDSIIENRRFAQIEDVYR